MIQVQRQLKEAGQDFRAFELLNLGKYERQHYLGVNPHLKDKEKKEQIREKERHYIELILHAYRAQPVTGFPTFHGKKAGRLVAIGAHQPAGHSHLCRRHHSPVSQKQHHWGRHSRL